MLEEYPTRPIAREREKYLKSGVGREFIRNFKDCGCAGLSTDR